MDSKYPKDLGFCEDCANESLHADIDTLFLQIDNLSGPSDLDQIDREHNISSLDTERGHSVLQMAFLQLMTRKVIEATANNSAVLHDLNSRIRIDKE